VRDFVEDRLGTNGGEMIIDSFASGAVPFQEADEGATTAQIRSQL
jgi:hypothetical protein